MVPLRYRKTRLSASQRRVFEPTGSSRHDESPYDVLGQSDSEEESEKVMLGADEGGQSERQAGPDAGAQDEGQAGSNPDETSKCQAGPDPGTLFFSDKPSDADKNAETKVESMVNVPIQQALSSVSLMTSSIIDLTWRPESPQVHQQFKATTTDTTTTTTTILPSPQAQQQSTAEAMMIQRIGELEHIMANLIQLFEALEKSMNHNHSEELAQYLAEARKKKKKSRESPKTPPGSPPPPPPAGPSGASGAPGTFCSSKTATSAEYQAWTTTNIRLRLSILLTPADLEIDEDMGPDEQAQSSDDEDIESAHIPKVNLRQDWWKPFKEERPATLEPAWLIQSSDVPVPTNNRASALASNYSPPLEDSLLAQTGPTFEIVKVFHPDVIHLQYQMEECHKLLTDNVDDPILRHNVSKPLPLGGPPGQVIIQSDFFFNKDLEYLRYGSKGRRPALQRFYIDRHTSKGDRRAVRTHMRILSVVRIEVFSMYGPIPVKPSKSLEPPPTGRQEDSYYDRQPMDPTSGYQKTPNRRGIGLQGKRVQNQQDESKFKYDVLDQEGFGSVQGVHVRYSEEFEDKADLSQPGELCWWTRQRRRLQTFEANPDGCSCWPKGRQFTTPCPLFKLIIDDSKKTYNTASVTLILEDMDAYRDEGMGDVIFGELFLREVRINARRFEGLITIYNGNEEVTYQMVRSHPRFKSHTNEQCNKIPSLLKDCLDIEDSCLWFYPSITRSSNPQLQFGNPISKSYRLMFIFEHT
uniref:Uncharacterized protein n=1 Tax=Tanacetum cinerariifolium TaxID=118510 RepID=A0A6L2N7H2_TANCI|nr:hypothetical protein [Tanacetum cinerariifolium]